jgi:hypothetical protein
VSVSRHLDKLGMRSSDTAEIALDDVAVPHADLVGLEPGRGFPQLMWQLQYERLAGAAASVGHASQVLDDTIAYAKERRTFGRPIAQHQVIAHKLADAATELEAARSLLYSTAWRVMHDEYPVAEISMTKKYCAQVQNRLVDACLQIFGGAGYLSETPVSRAFRDARLQRIGGGTDEIMNEVIAERMGLAVAAKADSQVVAALIKREQNGSTGFGKGVAVPHTKHPKIKQMAATVGRSAGGIDFAALLLAPVACANAVDSVMPKRHRNAQISKQMNALGINLKGRSMGDLA